MPTDNSSTERPLTLQALIRKWRGEQTLKGSSDDYWLGWAQGRDAAADELEALLAVPAPPAAPRYSSDPDQEELLRKLSTGELTVAEHLRDAMDKDICMRLREDAWEEL